MLRIVALAALAAPSGCGGEIAGDGSDEQAQRSAAVGVGINGPGIYHGDVAGALRYAEGIVATGATWARVGFRIDVWSGPDDSTPRGPQQLTYYQGYDQIVDYFTTHGVQVYGTVGGESVPGGGEPETDDYVTRYTGAFVKIFDHFKDRVHVFETFNEPNNWRAHTTRPAVSPLWLAKMHQSIYLNAKVFGGRNRDPRNQAAKIVSGALFSFEGTDAADYLTQFYQAGRSQLAFDWVRSNAGTYPLDGIGYHIYVGQGASATSAEVSQRVTKNLNGIWNAVVAHEPNGAATSKRLWLTEVGWTIDQVSAQQQADFLTTSFDAMANFNRVAAAFWFTFQDFPGGRYGIIDGNGLQRPAYASFQAVARKYPAGLNARFVADDVPATMQPGETRTVHITIENIGGQSWSEAAAVHLASAPGAPIAVVTNQMRLIPPPGGGYANSVTDTRLFFAPRVSVARGAQGTLQFDVQAPAAAGTYELGLEMVRENVAWFGDTFRRSITVAATP